MCQDATLLHVLREEITLYSNEVDRKDHLWSLDRVQGLLNEKVFPLVVVWFIVIQKFIWSKILGYATYYVVSLIRVVSSVVCGEMIYKRSSSGGDDTKRGRCLEFR